NQITSLQHRCDRACCRLDTTEVWLVILTLKGSGYSDQERVSWLRLHRGTEIAFGNRCVDSNIKVRLDDVNVTAIDSIHRCGVDIDSNDFRFPGGEHRGSW